MTAYAVITAVGLILLSIVGSREALSFATGCLGVTSLVLYITFRVYISRSTREVPPHRRRLERFVLPQWLGATSVGLAAILVPVILGVGTVQASRAVEALVGGLVIGSLAIFLSSLVDWYWILPRVSGLNGQAPCEVWGSQRWSRLTSVWLFHRAVATLVVCGVITGLVLYLGAGTSKDAHTAWTIAGGIIGAVLLIFNRDALIALAYSLNPPRHVGDLLKVDTQAAYMVDISLQGAKYKLLEGTDFVNKPFMNKADDQVGLWELRHRGCVTGSQPPCAKRCTGVNWYCRNNPDAHS